MIHDVCSLINEGESSGKETVVSSSFSRLVSAFLECRRERLAQLRREGVTPRGIDRGVR